MYKVIVTVTLIYKTLNIVLLTYYISLFLYLEDCNLKIQTHPVADKTFPGTSTGHLQGWLQRSYHQV